MARPRLIIHGSLEELEMFEPIYNTRLRLQHGAPPSRFYMPDPPASADSEREIEDMDLEGGVANAQTDDHNNGEAGLETACCSSDGEENDGWPDRSPRSGTPTEDHVGFADNGNTGAAARLSTRSHGNGSETPASASPDSDTADSDSDSDSDSGGERE